MNERMTQAREAGLARLQPTAAQLEHGLELHQSCTVVESYGFAPRGKVDGDALHRAVEAGASELELQDIHERSLLAGFLDDEAVKAEVLEAWEAAGVTCVGQNAGEEGQSVERLLKRLAWLTRVTDRLPDVIAKATTPGDIHQAKARGKRCLMFTGNGVPLPEDWVSIEEELRYISVFFDLGCRMMHLTYNRRNMIGDGCMETANAGLSDFGRAVVEEMNRVGVIVDTAHSGWQTSLEAARVSTVPMVASHSGCAAINPHPRCKPDEVIKAIADTGGYIGICCIPHFLGRSGDINAMLDHIEYACRLVGSDHVAIGTDVAYVPQADPAEPAKVPTRPSRRARWENYWRPGTRGAGSGWGTEEQVQSMAWTNWPLFTVGMVQRGFSDEDIEKVLGGNVLRVAGDVLRAAGHPSE